MRNTALTKFVTTLSYCIYNAHGHPYSFPFKLYNQYTCIHQHIKSRKFLCFSPYLLGIIISLMPHPRRDNYRTRIPFRNLNTYQTWMTTLNIRDLINIGASSLSLVCIFTVTVIVDHKVTDSKLIIGNLFNDLFPC